MAGLHLSSLADTDRNAQAVRSKVGVGFKLLRVSTWEEGLAVSPSARERTVQSVMRSRLRWVGREPGSGAHQCLQELSSTKPVARRMARDHRGVVEAIRCGWADVGVCVRLTCEEAGLRFLSIRNEFYELCYPVHAEGDPRIQALLRVARSTEYRRLLADLPGYSFSDCGETSSVA